MSTNVVMPQMGESITEGTITKWLKRPGEAVERDEPLFEVSTDKVDAEIPSPTSGIMGALTVQEGATVEVGAVVCSIDDLPTRSTSGAPRLAGADNSSGSRRTSKVQTEEAPASALSGHIPVDVSAIKSIWHYSKGDSVGKISSITDVTKAAQEIQPSPNEQINEAAKHPETLDITDMSPSVSAVGTSASSTSPAQAAGSSQQLGELIPMTKMRMIIAKRMVESKQTSPHVHAVFKVDMTPIVRLREREKQRFEQRNGVKLTYMPFIARATVHALRKHPIVNAAIQGDAIFYNRNIDLGIAVSLNWGLIVPVMKHCEEMSFVGLARSISQLADRARTRKLSPDEVSGGTFTITNSGIFGDLFATPIINQPQVAILACGGLNEAAEVYTDSSGAKSLAIRSIQHFTLGFDHRIVDGADANRFMSALKTHLQDWDEEVS